MILPLSKGINSVLTLLTQSSAYSEYTHSEIRVITWESWVFKATDHTKSAWMTRACLKMCGWAARGWWRNTLQRKISGNLTGEDRRSCVQFSVRSARWGGEVEFWWAVKGGWYFGPRWHLSVGGLWMWQLGVNTTWKWDKFTKHSEGGHYCQLHPVKQTPVFSAVKRW